jgi:hypothetical protein
MTKITLGPKGHEKHGFYGDLSGARDETALTEQLDSIVPKFRIMGKRGNLDQNSNVKCLAPGLLKIAEKGLKKKIIVFNPPHQPIKSRKK